MAKKKNRTIRTDAAELATRARAALERGDLEPARDGFARLEDLEPGEPEWPRQLATVHRLADDFEAELDALVRCGDRQAAREQFLSALATYKMVLSVHPEHPVAQARMLALQPSQSQAVSVQYVDSENPCGAPATVGPVERPARAAGEDPDRSAPLDELVLTDIVAGAHPAHIADDTLDGIHEIPLDLARQNPRPPAAIPLDAIEPLDDEARAQASRLGESPLFDSLDRQSLARLVQQVRLVQLEAGQELFHQGDPAGALYVVVQGAVVPIAEGKTRTRLAVLEPGEFFGEISLFTNQPRNATVEALVDSQLLEIDRNVMWDLVQSHAQVLSKLLHFLRERLIQRLVRTSPLFQIFSRSKRSAIAQRFRFLEVADGHTVIDQHRPTEAIFILLSGHMEVVHCDDAPDGRLDPASEKVLASLEPGDLFGEMSLLWREPSLASVVARGKCWLLALPAQTFQQMLDHHPELAAGAARIARERRAQNLGTLRDALRHRDGKAGII